MSEKKRILKERAEQLARRPEPREEAREYIEVLEFRMASERYAIEVATVHGVVPLQQYAHVPCTPAFVFGIMNVRGRIVSLVDLRQFFNLPGTIVAPQTTVIILRNPAMEFGVLADAVHATRSVPMAMRSFRPLLRRVAADPSSYEGLPPTALFCSTAAESSRIHAYRCGRRSIHDRKRPGERESSEGNPFAVVFPKSPGTRGTFAGRGRYKMKWLDNLSTRNKLVLGFGLLIVILAATILIASYSIAGIAAQQQNLTDREIPLALGLETFRGDLNRQHSQFLQLTLTEDPAKRAALEQELRQYSDQIDTNLATLSALGQDDPAFVEQLDTIMADLAAYRETREEQINLINAGNASAAQNLSLTVQAGRIESLRSQALDLINVSQQNVHTQEDAALRQIAQTQLIMGIMGLVAVIAGIVLVMTLTASIAHPLRRISMVAEQVAAGDLSVQVPEDDRSDEVGMLNQSTRQMVESLRTMNQQIQEGINVLATSVNEITSSMAQISSGAQETATAISQTTTTAEEVRQTTQTVSQKAKDVSDLTRHASEMAQKGRASVDETIQGMNRIQAQMNAIGESIARLNEQNQAIGEIIDVVDDITEQVNILSVNAAIEAARAGAEGKGFAVVAQEIRSLAEQTKQATTQIQRILKDVQRSVSAAVMAVDQGNRVVEAGVQQSRLTGQSIRSLEDTNTDSARAASHIAASSQEQLVGMEQVASAMESIKIASTQNVQAAREGETIARNLQELGLKLRALMDRYKHT